MGSFNKYCKGRQAHTQKAKCYGTSLKILIFPHIGLLILDVLSLKNLIPQVIIGILMLLGLIHAFNRYSYKSMIMVSMLSYCLFCLFLIKLLTIVQHQENVSSYQQKEKLQFITLCIGVGKSMFWMIYTYFPYRQFKVGFFQYLDKLQEKENATMTSKQIIKAKTFTNLSEMQSTKNGGIASSATISKPSVKVIRKYLQIA